MHYHCQSHYMLGSGQGYDSGLHPNSSVVLLQMTISLCSEHSLQIPWEQLSIQSSETNNANPNPVLQANACSGLTPKDHHQQEEYHSRDRHKQVSIHSVVDLLIALQFQTCGQDHAWAHHTLCNGLHRYIFRQSHAFEPSRVWSSVMYLTMPLKNMPIYLCSNLKHSFHSQTWWNSF